MTEMDIAIRAAKLSRMSYGQWHAAGEPNKIPAERQLREELKKEQQHQRKLGAKRFCVVCGRDITHLENTRYCSELCRRKALGDEAPERCIVCGGPILGKPGTKFCCIECRKEYEQKQKRQQETEKLPPRICPICGRPVPKTRNANAIYCSRECAVKACHRDAALAAKSGEAKTRTCPICGMPFVVSRDHHKYCSSTCRYEAKLRRLREKEKEK